MADEKVKVSSLVTVAPKTTDKVLITTTDDSGQLQTRNALVSDIRNLAASLEDSEDKAINVKIANKIVKKVTDLAGEVDTSFETVNQNFTNVNNAISKNRDNITTANENMTAHEEDTDLHVTAEKQQKWDGYDQSIKDVKEIADNNTTQLKEKANKNTEELVYYVSKNGNDNNDGLSADKPFLTINKAISKIPNFIANNITVNIADGTYNEEINIEGKNGGSIITIKGNTSTPSNVTINNARVRSCTCLVVIDGFKAITTAKTSFIGSNSTYVDFSHCISNVSASIIGLQATMSNVILRNSEISNKTSYGILSEYNSNLISIGNTGTTNNTALLATYGGTISKSGTQPSGTISESSINGGAIR